MFELFSGERRREARRATVPVVISIVAHVIVVGLAVVIPLAYVATEIPAAPDVLAFIVPAAPPPPPPPPPPAPPPARQSTPARRPAVKPVPAARPQAAPVEAPAEIVEEPQFDVAVGEGVLGGVEGGVIGGVVGGVVGGLVADLPPPPPPSAPVAEPPPVRVGGALKAPALVQRVEPEYPPLAVRAQVQGTVILEAVVDREGRVEEVRVLRSIPLLDEAAVAAVRKWRYSPLLLNGQPERFVLTVTVSFSLGART